ncbi:hypothetical protein V8C86DRAFT_2672097 [Haematococcus lacustris]
MLTKEQRAVTLGLSVLLISALQAKPGSLPCARPGCWGCCVPPAPLLQPAGPLSHSHSPSSWGGALQLLLALLHQAGQPLVVGLL